MFRLAKLSLANRALIALITGLRGGLRRDHDGLAQAGAHPLHRVPAGHGDHLDAGRVAGGRGQAGQRPAGNGAQRRRGPGVDARRPRATACSTDQPGVHLRHQPGPGPEPGRPGHLQRPSSRCRTDVQPRRSPAASATSRSCSWRSPPTGHLSELNAELTRLTVPRLQKLDGVRGAEVTGGATQHIPILPRPRPWRPPARAPGPSATPSRTTAACSRPAAIEEDGKTLRSRPAARSTHSTPSRRSRWAAPATPQRSAASPTSASPRTPDLDHPDQRQGDAGPVRHQEARRATPWPSPTRSRTRSRSWRPSSAQRRTVHPVFDQAPFIEKSIKDLTTEGLLGLGFAVLVILVFLMSVRATLVTAISIPLSLLITFIGLSAAGYSLNILTLGALTIAIGRVVDDSIVVIENIKRHLSYGEDKRTAILTAVREVAGAITASTLTTVAVFLPIAFVGGLAGELFRPFALTVTIALLASLLVSLTIVPVLAYWFLGTPPAQPPRRTRWRSRRGGREAEQRTLLQRGYLPVLPDPAASGRHPDGGPAGARRHRSHGPAAAHRPAGRLRAEQHDRQAGLPAGHQPRRHRRGRAGRGRAARHRRNQDVQVTTGNAGAGFGASCPPARRRRQFTVVTDENADQAQLQDTVRSALGPARAAPARSPSAPSRAASAPPPPWTSRHGRRPADCGPPPTHGKAMAGVAGQPGGRPATWPRPTRGQVTVDRAKAVRPA